MFVDIIPTAVTVTGFVLVMMLLVESVNVATRGALGRGVFAGGGRLPAALVGVMPGCFGGFVNVTLYVHGTITRGALAGSMIAASGDEAFVMLALFPRRALVLFVLLFAYGLAVAFLVDRVEGACRYPKATCESGLAVHDDDVRPFRPWGPWRNEWRLSGEKVLLVAFVLLFAVAIGAGWLAEDEPTWVRTGVVAVSLVLAWLVVAAPTHFVRAHLLRHVIREHAPRVLLWTLGALAVTAWATTAYPGLEGWVRGHRATAMLIAALVGLIPESGPHMVFATLFASGIVPFSVLATSSVVQDGHGMLPLLAESRAEFARVKAINLVAGLVLGLAMMLAGF